MTRWFYLRHGETVGPVTSADLKELAASGELRPTDLVLREGRQKWVTAASVKRLFSEAAPVQPPEVARRSRIVPSQGNVMVSIGAAPRAAVPPKVERIPDIQNRSVPVLPWIVAGGALAGITGLAIALLLLNNRLVNAKNEVEEAQSEHTRAKEELDRIKTDLVKAKAQATTLAAELKQARTESESGVKEGEALAKQLARARAEAVASNGELAKARAEADAAKRELIAMERERAQAIAKGKERPKDTANEAAKPQASKAHENRYKWKTEHLFSKDLATHHVAVTGEGKGNRINILKGGGLFLVDGKLILDAPGTNNLHIRIDPDLGATTYAGLTFTTPCVLSIREDFTLCCETEGVVAKDQTGKSWKSRKVSLDGKQLNVFFPVP